MESTFWVLTTDPVTRAMNMNLVALKDCSVSRFQQIDALPRDNHFFVRWDDPKLGSTLC